MGDVVIKLTPCPFCGSENVKAYAHPFERSYLVMCSMCGAKSRNFPTKNLAANAWNRRVKPQ